MARRKRSNLPIASVIVASLVIHVAGLLILGGISIYNTIKPEEASFEAPPPEAPKEDNNKMRMQVRMEQNQKHSQRVTQKISVAPSASRNLSALSVDVPLVNTHIATGVGRGGSIGKGLGEGTIDLSRSAVNFFGIKSEGERILFIVDASKYILEDRKGGLLAYEIVKSEISSMVSSLAPGTLFNVLFYSGRNTYAFAPSPIAATQSNKARLANWVTPINSNVKAIGVKNNTQLQRKDIQPMGTKAREWPRAVQIALEQKADAIFLLTSRWQHHPRNLKPEEKEKWLRKKGWTEEDDEKWKAYEKEARAWLKTENEKRKEAGKPPRIVHWIGIIIRELHPKVKVKPDPAFSVEEVTDHITDASRTIAKELGRERAPINVVLFQGKNEKKDNKDVRRFKDVARKNRGKFRVLFGLEQLKSITARNARS